MERTDKIVATALQISRKDALTLIKKGRISANGKVIKDAKTKLDENSAELFFDDKRIYYNKYVYIMMNKPKGVISASNSKDEKTVIDILPDDMKRKNLFPAGRLDKDTNIRRWNAGEISVGLIHPASAGHGLNLQSGGNILVWFGLTWSLELYQQTVARLWRQGQKNTVSVIHIMTAKTIDDQIMNALETKDHTQSALIDAVKAEVVMDG